MDMAASMSECQANNIIVLGCPVRGTGAPPRTAPNRTEKWARIGMLPVATVPNLSQRILCRID